METGPGRPTRSMAAQSGLTTPRMLERLRAKYAEARAAQPAIGRMEVMRGDITALPFVAGAFDAVCSGHDGHLLSRTLSRSPSAPGKARLHDHRQR